MKFKLLLTTVFAFLLVISSCKKDLPPTIPPTQTYPIEGLWIGTYTADVVPEQGNLFYSLIVYPDGTLLTKGKGGDGRDYHSRGSWTLTSTNIFSATITSFFPNPPLPITQSITATYSNSGKLTEGTWHDTDNPYGVLLSGKFSTLQRVN